MTQSQSLLNPLSSNSTKWWNTLKQFVGNLQRNCLSVSDHFVGLTLTKVNVVSVSLKYSWMKMLTNFRFSTRKEYKINNYDNHLNFSICWYNFGKKCLEIESLYEILTADLHFPHTECVSSNFDKWCR